MYNGLTMANEPNGELRSSCPLTATLDVVGDRWMLVVLRDILIYGPVRFKDLSEAGEGIATNTLTDRLKRLESEGLIRSETYQERPRRVVYSATRKGVDLYPAMRALSEWGQRYVKGVRRDKSPLDYFAKQAKTAATRRNSV